MGATLADRSATQPTVRIAERAALYACDTDAARCTLVAGRHTIVISGTPRWSAPDLQRIAQSQGQATALLRAYEQHGTRLFSVLHGTFAFVILDTHEDAALLAVDRMGVQSLCYALVPGRSIAFGTTSESVRVHPDHVSELDPQALYHYLYFHVVPSPLTVFRGQRKLLPGQYLWYRTGETQQQFYWNPTFAERSDVPASRLAEELRERLAEAVRRCTSASAAGAFLSGGVDSSTVAGLLANLGPEPARTYSIGFDAPGYDEMDFARVAARHFRTVQKEYYVTPQDVADAIPKISAAYDEPFGNSSAVPAYYCARLAQADGIRTLLAGDGGDELFGGNARYAKQKVFALYEQIPVWLRRHVLEPAVLSGFGTVSVGPLRKARSYIEQARVPMPDRLETYNMLFRHPAEEILHPDLRAAVDLDGPLTLLRATYARARSTALVDRMLYLDWKQTLADNDLRKVNRMCALAGVEVCYPLLDDDIVELSTRVPPALKVKGQQLRYFFKWALRDFLPPSVLTKTKHGFGLPFGLWMRSHAPLRELAYDSLGALKRRHYVNPAYIDRLIELHGSDHASYYGEFVWVLMMLEQWLSRHADASAVRWTDAHAHPAEPSRRP